jgi:predicted oxidoreductase (fatty acid repression mutant protein)
VILFGDSHHKFWEIVRETLRKIVPEAAFAATSGKIDSFSAGFGTALFYEDQAVIKGLQEQFALYADNFPVWSEHSTAIAQFAAWTALAEIMSVRHFNTTIQLWMMKLQQLLVFHITGNFARNWSLVQLKQKQAIKIL